MIINLELSTDGIEKALKEVEKYEQDIKAKVQLVIEKLTARGVVVAQNYFAQAIYDGVNDVTVSATADRIIAHGKAVAFIEFGSGVTYGHGYKGEKPPEISAIGTYGYGRGKRPSWKYWDEEQQAVVSTQGNPPNMAMYHTSVHLHTIFNEVVREVFND